jgi:hypothetical protein
LTVPVTVTVNVQDCVFPQWSTKVIVTVVTPMGNWVFGCCESVGAPTGGQHTSLGIGTVKLTTAPSSDVQGVTMLFGQGRVKASTVTWFVQALQLPQASQTVNTT